MNKALVLLAMLMAPACCQYGFEIDYDALREIYADEYGCYHDNGTGTFLCPQDHYAEDVAVRFSKDIICWSSDENPDLSGGINEAFDFGCFSEATIYGGLGESYVMIDANNEMEEYYEESGGDDIHNVSFEVMPSAVDMSLCRPTKNDVFYEVTCSYAGKEMRASGLAYSEMNGNAYFFASLLSQNKQLLPRMGSEGAFYLALGAIIAALAVLIIAKKRKPYAGKRR